MNYLNALNPVLHEGTYVFTSVPIDTDTNGLTVVASMHEPEGLTLVLPKQQAMQRGFPIHFSCGWITLGAESALDSIGLTAAIARTLSDKSIPCNIVAGTYHDHLFVPMNLADAALQYLQELQRASNN